MAKRGRSARNKGMAAEREVAAILSDMLGKDVRRIYMSGMKGEGDLTGLSVHAEVKRQERMNLYAWIEDEITKCEPGQPLVIFHRQNSKPWLATMLLPEWIEMVRESL